MFWGLLLFFLGNFGALATALTLAEAAFPGHTVWRKGLATMTLYQVLISLIGLILGIAGLLRHFWIVALVLGLAGLVLMARRLRCPKAVDLPALLAALRPWSAFLAVAAAGLGIWFLRNAIMGGYYSFDDHTYHGTVTATWLLQGKIVPVFFTYQGYFALNAELLALWHMMPFGNEGYVSLTGLHYGTIILFLCLEGAALLRVPWQCGCLSFAVAMTSWKLFHYATSFTTVNLGVATVAMAAFTLIQPSALEDVEDSCHGVYRRLLAAGAVSGLAVGMKITFIYCPLVVFLLAMAACRKTGGLRLAIKCTAALALLVLLCGSYWYFRALAITGNPTYPAENALFSGPLDKASLAKMGMPRFLADDGGDPARHASEVRYLFSTLANYPYSHLAISVLGYAFGLAALAKSLRRPLSGRALALLTFLGVGLFNVTTFPMMPFSAYNEMMRLETTSRYLHIFYLSGLLLVSLATSALMRSSESFPKRLALLILLVAICLGWSVAAYVGEYLKTRKLDLGQARWLVVFAGAAGAAFVFWEIAGRVARAIPCLGSLAARVGAYGLITASIAALAVCYPRCRAKTDETVLQKAPGFGRSNNDAGWLPRAIETMPAGSRLSYFDAMVNLFPSYMLMGRKYQHRPVRLLPDGRVSPPLHQREPRLDGQDFFHYERGSLIPAVSAEVFLANFEAAKIDFLCLRRDDSDPNGPWPAARAFLQQSGRHKVWAARGADEEIWAPVGK